jgi:Lipopolysaccharide-assembly
MIKQLSLAPRKRHSLVVLVCVLLQTSCGIYSFSGATVPKEVKSISIQYIQNKAPNAWTSIDRIFNQELRNKLVNEAGLKINDEKGDYELKGSINSYSISAQTPTQGQISNSYRVQITVQIEFKDNVTDKKVQWTENFTNFEQYEGDISGTEDTKITNISKSISNSIFNKIFSTW